MPYVVRVLYCSSRAMDGQGESRIFNNYLRMRIHISLIYHYHQCIIKIILLQIIADVKISYNYFLLNYFFHIIHLRKEILLRPLLKLILEFEGFCSVGVVGDAWLFSMFPFCFVEQLGPLLLLVLFLTSKSWGLFSTMIRRIPSMYARSCSFTSTCSFRAFFTC